MGGNLAAAVRQWSPGESCRGGVGWQTRQGGWQSAARVRRGRANVHVSPDFGPRHDLPARREHLPHPIRGLRRSVALPRRGWRGASDPGRANVLVSPDFGPWHGSPARPEHPSAPDSWVPPKRRPTEARTPPRTQFVGSAEASPYHGGNTSRTRFVGSAEASPYRGLRAPGPPDRTARGRWLAAARSRRRCQRCW